MENTYFSSGEFCATAHQIRRHTKNQDAYFFDWLVTPSHSFDFMSRSNDGFLQPMGWDIVDRGIRLLDSYSGLLFQHEFECFGGGGIDTNLVDGHLESARGKFLYLKEKLINALKNTARGVIVRAENGIKSFDLANERLQQLQETFLPINAGLKFVIASTQLYCGEEFGSDHLFIHLDGPVPPNGVEAWKGNNQSWDRLFALAEEKLFRIAP
jgi:hypothetical protein